MPSVKRQITNTAIAYRSFINITNDEANRFSPSESKAQVNAFMGTGSQNIMTSAQGIMERIPGFADKVESVLTTFTAVSRSFWFAMWGGARFLSIVNDIAGGVSKVYKCEIGVDSSYVLIFTSASANPFDFVVSNNTLYMGNGTEMRKYSGNGSTTTKWGITRPAAPVSTGTTGTGISAFSSWCYRVTYGNSTTSHESSASDLSPCTGIVNNKTVTLPLVASADGQVDQIHVYRTTDGGSTDPTLMLEITGSPFSNTTQTINDTTTDANLSTRSAPSTTSNDPPTNASKLCAYAGRIFAAVNATVYYSAQEELPANGVPEECWPSGLDGNSQPYPQEVTSLRPQADGVAVFTRGKIWKIAGTQRDNFIFPGLLDRRGAISHTATAALGNSVAWLDTASQVFLDGQEIGFDIRNDIKNINQAQAYLEMHIQGRYHWVALLDGAAGKLYLYDMDTGQWLPPKILPAAAAALSSGEKSSGSVVLTVGLSKTQMYMMNATKYNDAGTTYSPVSALNLLRIGYPDGEFKAVMLETDSHTASKVEYLPDDDPTAASPAYADITLNVSDPVRRSQGTNLVKKTYQPESSPYCERVALKFTWATVDANFNCFNITLNPAITDNPNA